MDLKRAIDGVLASIALVLSSPLLVVVAISVKLDSRGPALFRQQRVGLDGELFHIHKFRSLRVGRDESMVCASDDPRITKVGAVLRRTKLDELPQLVDVVIGRMSMVGPRPELPRYVALWPADARSVILSVRPGITDPVTLTLRDEGEELASVPDAEEYYVKVLLPRKCAAYVAYVQRRTLWSDLGVLVGTVKAVARHPRVPAG